MARKVYITSEMSIDERLIGVAQQDPQAALLWPWLLTVFDDWGRAEANSVRLKAQVFPMNDAVTAELVEKALQLFNQMGLIVLYEVNGKRYMAVPEQKWFRYQTHIRHEKRLKDGSHYPAPPSTNTKSAQIQPDARTCAQLREDARNCAQVNANCVPSPSPSPSLSLSSTTTCTKSSTCAVDDLKKTAEKTNDSGEAVNCYLKTFGKWPSSIIYEELMDWLDRLGVELVVEAMRRTAAANTRSWRYTEAVLRTWADANVKTLDDVARLDAEHERIKEVQSNARTRAQPASKYVEGNYDWDRLAE